MYNCFYGTFTHACINNHDSATNSTFDVGGITLTNARTVVLHEHCGRKGKAEAGERSQTE